MKSTRRIKEVDEMFVADEEDTVASYYHGMTLAYIKYLQKVLDVFIRKLLDHTLSSIKVTAED